MVKPALPYLDIIADASQVAPDHPLACYQVSGEFAMVVAGARAGVYDLKTMAFESAESMLRAGVFGTFFTASSMLIVAYRCNVDTDLFHPGFLRLVRRGLMSVLYPGIDVS